MARKKQPMEEIIPIEETTTDTIMHFLEMQVVTPELRKEIERRLKVYDFYNDSISG